MESEYRYVSHSKSIQCYFLLKLKLKPGKALEEKSALELRDVACHTGSDSVTCHPTQVNALILL